MNAPLASPHRSSASQLRIGGFTPFSVVDFPNQLSAVVFCQGCPLNCFYCHNRHLIPPQAEHKLGWETVVAYLATRKGLLDAVTFSGGEPLAQNALISSVMKVKEMGFSVGLHTAGPFPSKLAGALPHITWVGLDVKTQFDSYECVTGVKGSGSRAEQSLDLILESGVKYEVRTTVPSDGSQNSRIMTLVDTLAAKGVKHFALQQERQINDDTKTMSNIFNNVEFLHSARSKFDSFDVRLAHA